MQTTQFEQYELLEKLDRPTEMQIYKAREVSTSREVLLRLLPAKLAAALRGEGHDEEEARRVVRLSHPNVLTVYEFSFGNGHPYVVSEPLDGYTLRERLSQGPLPLEEILTVATCVAAGLRYAHEHGIVHGHLSPEHIWMSAAGEVKEANFGFHRLRDGDARDLLGSDAHLYEAPEQWRGDTPAPASDLFSFGLILHEMLVGRPPERDPEGGVDLKPATQPSPVWRRTVYDRVHPGLSRLVTQCVEIDAHRRCSDFAEIQSELLAANALYIEASRKYAWRSPNPFWRGILWRRNFAATVVMVLALVGLIAAAALVVFR